MKSNLLLLLSILACFQLSFASIDTVQVEIINPSDIQFLEMPGQLSKYMLKAKVSKTDTASEWKDPYFEINGEKIWAYAFGEYLVGEWTPESYDTYTIYFNAETTADSSIMGKDTATVMVLANAYDQNVTAFDSVKVKFGGEGRTRYATANLPNYIGAYDSLHAVLEAICPTGDCDPWDRKAWIEAKGPNGDWIELIRYMTPYGVSCTHHIDLSEYLFMIQGKLDFKIFTDTWAGSWVYTLKLEYYAGTPDYKYGNAISVYSGNYAFGDYANLQPFPLFEYEFNTLEEKAQFNFLTSGHGWGSNNTGNAAEFYNATHKVRFNNDSINQNPWNDCNPNPDNCTGQAGTWQHNRAGWCPGAITYPFVYDVSSYIANGNLKIGYTLQEDYVDLCHPNYPNLPAGCDPNSGENPYYVVGATLLTYGNNEPMETKSRPIGLHNDDVIVIECPFDLSFKVFPNPAKEEIFINYDLNKAETPFLIISDATGKNMRKYSTAQLKKNLTGISIDLSNFANGLYFIDLYNGKKVKTQKIIVNQ